MNRANVFDPEKYEVAPNIFHGHFVALLSVNIRSIDPRLIINLDETGLGTSESRRVKGQNGIVSMTLKGTLVYRQNKEKRFVLCFASITASERMPSPALVADRKNDAQDSTMCPSSSEYLRYHDSSAFATRNTFGDHLRHSFSQ